MQVRFPEDSRFPAGKIAFLQYLVAITFLCLLAGYWRLQVQRHAFYVEQADRNRIRNLPVIAPRGRILDREGRVLVDNFPAFSVLMSREDPARLSQVNLQRIAGGLHLDPAELEDEVRRTVHLPRFQPILIKSAASLEDIAFVESHRVDFPELDLIQVQQRFYLKHGFAASMLGYVGEVSPEEIGRSGSRYLPGDVVGKFGIEKQYDSLLAGHDGMRRVVVNSRGQEVGSMTTLDPTSGSDLRLTIDLDLQMTAETMLGDKTGAVVALDPRSGEVLAMASHPDFDPNDFAGRLDRGKWKALNSDPEKPLMNKAIQAQLAPGSIFKIVTATAALETGTIKPDFSINCAGIITFYGHPYHDWVWSKHRGHGHVDLHRAIVQSCDIYFYTVGKMLGIDRLAFFAHHLGLGARTGIDLPGEDSGVMPSPEWVERVFKRKWYAGETISVAIGQGAVAVTPLQVAYMIGGVASGGEFHRPHLVQWAATNASAGESRFPLSADTVDAVTKGMWGVVNEGGTGAAAHCPGIDIAGKTGTAQVVSVALKDSAHNARYKNTAWFVGYAPSTNPEIVVAALVMHGEHSTVAVPIVREVIKAYFDKKNSHLVPVAPRVTQAKAAPLNLQKPAPVAVITPASKP